MARYRFSGQVEVASGKRQFPLFTDQALSTPATDLLDESHNAIALATRGFDFYGPDGVSVLWGQTSNDSSQPPTKFVAVDAPAAPPPVPAGGTAGQVLVKASDNDGDVAWAAPTGGSSAISVPAPDWSIDPGDDASWLSVWRVYWPGGSLTLPHAFVGADPGVVEIALATLPVSSMVEYGASTTLVYTDNDEDPPNWTDDTAPGNGVTVAEGVYALVLLTEAEGISEPPVCVPDLADSGLLLAPPPPTPGS